MPARANRSPAPRSRDKRVRAPEATRERLVAAAFEEIHRHGYQGAGLDTILANAGVTKGRSITTSPTRPISPTPSSTR